MRSRCRPAAPLSASTEPRRSHGARGMPRSTNARISAPSPARPRIPETLTINPSGAINPPSRVDAKRSERSYRRFARSSNVLLATRGAKPVSVYALRVSERHRHARLGATRNEMELTLSRCRERGFDNAFVELRSAVVFQLLQCFLHRHFDVAVRAATRHRVERIRDRDDARFDRNEFALEGIGHAGTVDALMVRPHDVQRDRRVSEERREYSPSHDRMRHDVLIFFV